MFRTMVRAAGAALVLVVALLVAAPVLADAVLQLPDSGNLQDYRGQSGATGTFRVTGETDGRVFGTGVYTDDSDVGTAAVHAGLVRPGETRDLGVRILSGKSSYRGSGRNGVTSEDYGAWDGSFEFLDQAQPAAAATNTRSGGALPDPGDLRGYRANVGRTYNFEVVGSADGVIYGDGIYTDDSNLATAAVHAGLLYPGQTGVVAVVIAPGQRHYVGATRHNIDSRDFGSWQGSFRFAALPAPASGAIPDPGDMQAYRGHNGQVFRFSVTGSAQGVVYGDGVYTDDTRLAAAAVHAGLLADGENGVVSVEVLPGQSSYDGANRNGINSLSYRNWQGSYRFVSGE